MNRNLIVLLFVLALPSCVVRRTGEVSSSFPDATLVRKVLQETRIGIETKTMSGMGVATLCDLLTHTIKKDLPDYEFCATEEAGAARVTFLGKESSLIDILNEVFDQTHSLWRIEPRRILIFEKKLTPRHKKVSTDTKLATRGRSNPSIDFKAGWFKVGGKIIISVSADNRFVWRDVELILDTDNEGRAKASRPPGAPRVWPLLGFGEGRHWLGVRLFTRLDVGKPLSNDCQPSWLDVQARVNRKFITKRVHLTEVEPPDDIPKEFVEGL